MFDLQLLAFQGDITRVVTFQLAREASTRTYPEIGVPEPHHPITHHGGDPEKLDKMAKVNQFHVSLFAEFLEKMTRHRKRTVRCWIIHCICTAAAWAIRISMITATCRYWLPVERRETCAVGRHMKFDKPTPLANLHLTLLNNVGVPLETFGDSDGTVDDLFDPVSL